MSGFPEGYVPSADEVRNHADLSAGDLYQLAWQHPQLRPAVAEHPNCYPDLLNWLRQQQDPAINEALARRDSGQAATGAQQQPADDADAAAQHAAGLAADDPERTGSDETDSASTATTSDTNDAPNAEADAPVETETPIFGATPNLNATADLSAGASDNESTGAPMPGDYDAAGISTSHADAPSDGEQSPQHEDSADVQHGENTTNGEESSPLTAERSTPSDDEVSAALDPNLSAGELHAIAANQPDMHVAVASHPNAYPDLLKWLASLGDPAVLAAIEARQDATGGPETTEIFPAVGAGAMADNARGANDSWTYGQEDYALAAGQGAGAGSYPQEPAAQQPPLVAPTQQYQSAPMPAAQYQAPMHGGYGAAESQPPAESSGGVGRSILLGVLIGLLLVGAAILLLWWAPWASDEEPAAAAKPTTTATATPSAEDTDEARDDGESPSPEPSEEEEEDVDKSEYLPTGVPVVDSLESPTGNIACEAQSDTQWACTIFEHDFSSALGVDCDGPFSIRFNKDGDASGVCDTLVYYGDDVIDYDNTVQLGDVAGCTSKLDGMRCWDGASNTGFNIAREGIESYSS